MILAAGTSVDKFLTVVRNGQEYPLDDCLVVAPDPHNPEYWVARIRNQSTLPATYGVILAGNGHNIHQKVAWGFGLLQSGRMGKVTLQSAEKLLSDGATLQVNIIVDPGMFVALYGRVTWAAVPNCPMLQLGAEIAGVEILEARLASTLASGWPAPGTLPPTPPTI